MSRKKTDFHDLFKQCKSALPRHSGSVYPAFHQNAGFSAFFLLFLSWIPTYTVAQKTTSFTHISQTGFIENKGQIIDQNNNPNPNVLYLLNTPGFNVQLRKNGWSYDVYTIRHEGMEAARQEARGRGQGSRVKGQEIQDETFSRANAWSPLHPSLQYPASSIQFHRIDFDLVDTDSTCDIVAHDPSTGYQNYYTTGTPEKGSTVVHTYSSITYRNIYKNIDLEFTSNAGEGFKYTFVIHPGGNPDVIRMHISGACEIHESTDGLLIRTSVADVEETIPHTYLMHHGIRTETKSRFHKINENLYGISVDQPIPTNAVLTIDPVPNRLWGTYFGGDPAGTLGDNDITTSVTY